MDDKKHPTQPDGSQQSQKNHSQTTKGAESPASPVQAGPSRSVFAKRWLYPAIYLGAAALIIGLMYMRSQMGTHPAAQATSGSQTGAQTPSQPTTAKVESSTYQWPVDSSVTPVISKGFFQANGSAKQQAAELVSFNVGYSPHLGYDIKASDGAGFTVTSAAAGQVTSVGHSALNNYTVDVLSNDGNIEKYQSLSRVNVKQGQTVKQGDVIGTSGKNEYEASQGNHLYFEVDNNANQAIDPSTLLPNK